MKKILLLTILFFSFIMPAFCDVMPYYINSLRRYGIGYNEVKSPLILRDTPSSGGKVLETINFDYNNNSSCIINKNRCSVDEIFSAYSKDKQIALMTTIDESQGWNLVCSNQNEAPICGWVDEKINKYYSWSEFFDILGKKYGLYLFKDIQKMDKTLYAAPHRQSNSTGVIELPKYITPWLIRGNWMLVKVYDFNSKQKTGWLNYRDNKGKLKVFVKL